MSKYPRGLNGFDIPPIDTWQMPEPRLDTDPWDIELCEDQRIWEPKSTIFDMEIKRQHQI